MLEGVKPIELARPEKSLSATLLLGTGDPEIEATFRTSLSSLEFRMDIVGRGGELVRVLLSSRYDLVALDLALPGLPGVALFEVVRRIAPDTLLVVMVPEESLELETWVREGGAFYFLVKPVEEQEVALVLRDALSFLCREKQA